MRKWIALLLLWGFAWPAMAAKPLSIAALEQMLAGLHDSPDEKVAAALDNVQLTERVSRARLARWDADFPGAKTREALMRLADLSAFLNPPAADVLPNPAPAIPVQKEMLTAAVRYATATMSRLPDLYATRVTTHFENTLIELAGVWFGGATIGPQHTAVFRRIVTYRDGHEVPFVASRYRERDQNFGLTTSGEFGPTLVQVLRDALVTGVRFLRWERGAAGEPAAVFAYAVPEKASHFRVGLTIAGQLQNLQPAYHGAIKIDPATGRILRLTEIAEMAPPRQIMIEVDYAPVAIAARSYMLPVRGVAFSAFPVLTDNEPAPGGVFVGTETDPAQWPQLTNLNDVSFRQYHQFRATVRILSQGSADAKPTPGPKPAPESPQ